jgi:hypothetical protein
MLPFQMEKGRRKSRRFFVVNPFTDPFENRLNGLKGPNGLAHQWLERGVRQSSKYSTPASHSTYMYIYERGTGSDKSRREFSSVTNFCLSLLWQMNAGLERGREEKYVTSVYHQKKNVYMKGWRRTARLVSNSCSHAIAREEEG